MLSSLCESQDCLSDRKIPAEIWSEPVFYVVDKSGQLEFHGESWPVERSKLALTKYLLWNLIDGGFIVWASLAKPEQAHSNLDKLIEIWISLFQFGLVYSSLDKFDGTPYFVGKHNLCERPNLPFLVYPFWNLMEDVILYWTNLLKSGQVWLDLEFCVRVFYLYENVGLIAYINIISESWSRRRWHSLDKFGESRQVWLLKLYTEKLNL